MDSDSSESALHSSESDGDDTSERERESARQLAHRISVFGGLTTVALGLSIVAVVGTLPLSYQYVPFAISILVLGLPHGAVDHLVLPRARNEPVTYRSMAAIGTLYLVVGSLYLLVWILLPAAAFVFFILLTLAHWGQGDVYSLRALTGVTYLESHSSRLLALVVRGGLPMLVPLIAFPEQYAFVASTIVGLFDPAGAASLEAVFSSTARLAVAVGFGSLLVLSLVWGYSHSYSAGERERWLIDALETIGLVVFFATVPPILAIGLYFCFWHSLRHILRTMLVDDVASRALERGDLRTGIWRFARDATPLTLGGLAVLVGIALTVPQTPGTLEDALALYLVTIAVLTLPHVVVVSGLDRIQGLWR